MSTGLETPHGLTDEQWEAYYTLACRLLEIVVRDYKWAYMRYKQGYCPESRWRSEMASFRDDTIQALINIVLHDTGAGLQEKIENIVDKEMEARRHGRYS